MKKKYELVTRYSKIVDDYVSEHGVLPPRNIFKELGGSIPFVTEHFGSYRLFCDSLGYEKIKATVKVNQKYYLIDVGRNNAIVAHDFFRNINIDYFPEIKEITLRGYKRRKVKIKNRYRIVKDLEEL